jgi:predicted hotdog family 3-hydroxylacyl-ACP dehydratase
VKNMDIRRFLPQREPMLMVDDLHQTGADSATTSFLVRAGNVFLDEDSRLAEVAVIEHQAQSASAFAGKQAVDAGATTPPVGLIAEIRHFHCVRRPSVGDTLMTTVNWGAELAGMSRVKVSTAVNGEAIATGELKVYINSNDGEQKNA